MDHSVQGCFLPHNTCKFCGAGAHNKYQHDENCLINVPLEFMPHWRRGFDDARDKKGMRERINTTAGIIYLQGYGIGAKQNAAGRAATSPERGIGVDLTL